MKPGNISRRYITMSEQKKASESRPYMAKEIPTVIIDYRGLIAYAKSKNKTVPELSDAEKNPFISDSSMQEIRKLMLVP